MPDPGQLFKSTLTLIPRRILPACSSRRSRGASTHQADHRLPRRQQNQLQPCSRRRLPGLQKQSKPRRPMPPKLLKKPWPTSSHLHLQRRKGLWKRAKEARSSTLRRSQELEVLLAQFPESFPMPMKTTQSELVLTRVDSPN